jgi:exosortase
VNNLWAAILLIAGGVACFQPMRWLAESWIVNPYYLHGFIVAFASLCFVFYRSKNSKIENDHNKVWTYYITAGVVLYAIGFVIELNYLKAVPVFFVLLSAAYLLGGKTFGDNLRFPLLFPIIAVPIPFLPELTAFLQFAMAGLSTGILHTFGYEIHAEGALIHLPEATFLIAEPSSGIQSLIALLTLMIPVVYFTKTDSCKKIYLYLLIVPIAVLSNLLRIITLFLVGYYYGETVADEFWHDKGNILFFGIALTLLFFTWYLFVYGFKSPKKANQN